MPNAVLQQARRRIVARLAPVLATKLALSLWFALAVLAALVVCRAAGQTTLFAPLAGTAVIVFGAPGSSMARWRAVFGGHLLSAAVGLLCIRCVPADWAAYAVVGASALAFLLMLLTDTMHSPAGANPTVLVGLGMASQAVLGPLVLSLLAILLIARLAKRLHVEKDK